MTYHQNLAAQKYPRAVIEGDGGFALLVQREGIDITRVVLFPSQADAERSRAFYNASVIQRVEPCPVPERCTNIGYDREERRRERQEKAEQ